MKADIEAADRGEPVSLMEPLLVGDTSRYRAELTDLAFELEAKAHIAVQEWIDRGGLQGGLWIKADSHRSCSSIW